MSETMEKREVHWTFLTNHAHVLLCLVQNSSMRIRDIAEAVGITQRAVQRIMAELDDTGYIDRIRDGRRNSYQVHLDKHLRHPLEAHQKIGGLVRYILND